MPGAIFKKGMCDGAFLTREYTYDAGILKDYLLKKLSALKSVEIRYGIKIEAIEKNQDAYQIRDKDGGKSRTAFLLNAAYVE